MSRNQMAELVKYATGVVVCRRKGCAPEGGFSPLPYISQADCFFCPVSPGEGCLGVRARLALCVGSSPSLN